MQEFHVEQCGRRVIPENKEGVVLSTGATKAYGKRNVHTGHGCVGSSDFWHTTSVAGMGRKDSLETDSIRE